MNGRFADFAVPVAPTPLAAELYHEHERNIHVRTDRLFAGLMMVQWLAAIAAAYWISPRAWAGTLSWTHLHVWAAIYLGGVITMFPVALAILRPGRISTRFVIATAQMLMSSLLIHFTGGRIETHFHVFGSLAFLSFYRDWRVLIPATIVVALDHFVRGVYWPQSVFGVMSASQWRWLEHAGWVLFEDVFLIGSCLRSRREMWSIAERTAALFASDERYRAIVDRAEGIFLADATTKRILECNAAFRSLLGYTAEDLSSLTIDDFDADGREVTTAAVRQVVDGKHPIELPRRYRRKDGSVCDVTVDLSVLSYAGSEILCAAVRDVTEQKRAERALLESEERYALAARGANDGLWDWHLASGAAYFSPRWKDMLGLGAADAPSRIEDWFARVHPDDLAPLNAAVGAHLAGDTSHFEHEFRVRHADGSHRWVLCRGLAVRDAAGFVCRMAGSQTDITERHVVQEQLRHAALHDSLTGLPNRALFMELLERAILRASRRPHSLFAVLFLDVDRFKVVNDSLGHFAGDELLVGVAKRLAESLRPSDVIARLGGDEFSILVDDLGEANEASRLADRLHTALQVPFAVGGSEVFVSASIGIAVHAPQYRQPEELLRDADTAMYRAKSRGTARHEVFDADMHARAVARLHLENDLRRALTRNEFVVHYQPIIDLATGAVLGVEALTRWRHPDGRLIPPAEFIPVAEETGLIVPLGAWVLKEACRQGAIWREHCPPGAPMAMTVNLSAAQLEAPDLLDTLKSTLRDSGLAPGSLRLEITETALIRNPAATADLLHAMKRLGVGIYLDDFGTGYSSLSYLHRFPIDALKIDRSFVSQLDAGDNGGIVGGIVALARNLGLEVVAEGVENARQVDQLRRINCHRAQGFFFSKPVDADTLTAIIRTRGVVSLHASREFDEIFAPS